MRSDTGFTLVESLVATALMLTVSGAVFALMTQGLTGSHAQPEAADMQQRVRVATEAIQRDLRMAGAGIGAGPLTGPLGRFLAPVVPRRIGLQSPDAFGTARGDAIAITYASASHWQTTTLDPMSPVAPSLRVDARPNCPAGRPVCGYATGTDLLVFDRAGTFDHFTVSSVAGGQALLRAHRQDATSAYAAGAFVTPAETHIYWFDAANRQLRHYDGDQSDVPVADNVVDVRFEYFGESAPPVHPKPAMGVANCLYDASGVQLPMPALAADGGSLAPLPLSILADGPWCGEGANRYDADLLRVRRVRVTLRVQAAQAAFRATGPAFAVPGTARNARIALPDLTVQVDVAPRNLTGGR